MEDKPFIEQSFGSSFRADADADSFRANNNEDEIELQWAAIERLPTLERISTSLFDHNIQNKDDEQKKMVDVTKLGALECRLFIDRLINHIEQDNQNLLLKIKERIQKVGLQLPTVEVRYKALSVDADCEIVPGNPLPSIWNTLRTAFSGVAKISGHKSRTTQIKILKDVSGIIKPSRMTLLLGPPGCGKTTLLQALAGKLTHSLTVEGEISYNGYNFNEFVPQKTSAYISQYDLHISEMTVRETLNFSARCLGVGDRADIMKELSRREQQLSITPDPDIDAYMKAISVEGLKRTLQTDYILKILGLDICADTIVGDDMNRGISGGQKKRLTTGEMIIGPTNVLFMDEISNGLDSSSTFQIVTCLQQLTHITRSTILVSLLQPAPETFNLFDDVVLMAEGRAVYHGPRDCIVEFFEHCGVRCPPRKGIADFLQEAISEKNQADYWYREDQPYSYISVDEFADKFTKFHVGHKLDQELSSPFVKTESHKNALLFNIYSVKKWELFKACLAREWLLMKRNSFVHVFKSAQLVIVALLTMTVFLRSQMETNLDGGKSYMGAIYYTLIRFTCNGITELPLTLGRLSVFYKQRDLYPAWTYAIPASILKIPQSLIDASLWTVLTYYVIGFSPEAERFFCQFLLLFLLHQVSVSFFRLIASIVQNPPIAATAAIFCLMVMFLFGGILIPRSSLPAWLEWAFWLSPLTYAEIAASVNEFLAPRWQKISYSNTTVGDEVLNQHNLNYSQHFYWISIGVLVGYWVIFNFAFTCALSYLKPPGSSRAIISHEKFSRLEGEKIPRDGTQRTVPETKNIGMILPFEPIAMSFENVQYFVDTPQKLRERAFPQKRLQLLQDITGSFRPGILTALMGVSGAGKTTLMDVLSGRKTGGVIEGEIRVGGYPKVQETYARISGYCEQTDIHSPQVTIEESVMYSARLRLPAQIDSKTRNEFVAEVLKLIELDEIKDALVGISGASGISIEQRKRLTIAVELVSNPSIIFMDEPTSGLDARAAAIVMRVVKNIVRTNRTVVCTIHQPSIDIFEAFDELLLLKRGGQMVYSGELGENSNQLIQYFESIPGVPKIKENYNPATWMLEITSPSAEVQFVVDLAVLYKESHLYQRNGELVKELSVPPAGSKDLHFCTHYSQNGWEQFKSCLWKQNLSYWRSPVYNLLRLSFIVVSSLLFGTLLWRKGKKLDREQDFSNMLGSTFIFIFLIGISSCSPVISFIARERTVVYRERFAGMYSPWAYSFAQVTVELPYTFVQAASFLIITYPMVNFYWSAYKVFWYFYAMFCTLLYFNYLGILLVSLTPSFQVASVLASFCYTLFGLFAGFVIPGPKIPKWWVWFYWICPTSWSLKGILTSQYGDITDQITVHGESKAMNEYLKGYYGYEHDQLGVIAIVLLAYPLVFASGFAYAIAKLNFQRR